MPVLFTGASYAIPPAIQVTTGPQSIVGVVVNKPTNITVKAYDIQNWDFQGFPTPPWIVTLHCSGPGVGTFGTGSGEMIDPDIGFTTTFQADTVGEYTINATVRYTLMVVGPWGSTSYENITLSNSTNVSVTSGVKRIPIASLMIPVSGTASPTSSPATGTPTPSASSASPSPPASSSPAASPQNTIQPTPATTPGASQETASPMASPSPSPTPMVSPSPAPATSMAPSAIPGQSGDSGSTTTYLLIAIVALIAIVGVMAGYILGNRKK